MGIVPSDNDLSYAEEPVGRRVPIPVAVQWKIDALAQEACFGARAHGRELLPLHDYYGSVFQLRAPDSLELYFFDRTEGLGHSVYFFFLYRPSDGALTASPQAIYGKWAQLAGDADQVIQRPAVSFEDLDHDGHPELVVRERAHNGSSYNASIRHYYRIEPDLGLTPILAVEERSYQDVTTPNTWLVRRLRYLSKDSLTLTSFLQVPGQRERRLGQLLLVRNMTVGYHVVRTDVEDSKYRDALLTDSPAHDENFVVTGETLWY